MGIKKALLFSFACHLIYFSFFSFKFDIKATDNPDRLSVAFLGSILQRADFYSYPGKIIKVGSLSYAKAKAPPELFSAKQDKPSTASVNVSPAKLLNKFVVFEKKVAPTEKEKAQDKYLSSRPAWERVNLKLKIE